MLPPPCINNSNEIPDQGQATEKYINFCASILMEGSTGSEIELHLREGSADSGSLPAGPNVAACLPSSDELSERGPISFSFFEKNAELKLHSAFCMGQ